MTLARVGQLDPKTGNAGKVVRVNAAGNEVVFGSLGDSATDAEFIRDTMGTALVQGANVTITVNDAGDTITVAAAAVALHSSASWNVAVAGNSQLQLGATPFEETLRIYKNGLLLRPGAGFDYTISGTLITFAAMLTVGDVIADFYLTTATYPVTESFLQGVTTQATVSLVATSTLTSAAIVTQFATVALASTSTLTSAAIVTQLPTVALTATSTLTATPT